MSKGRKMAAFFTAVAMTLGSTQVISAAGFPDMPNNWATEALSYSVEKGYLSGMDGKLMPNSQLTRAQMASVLNRALGNQQKADISKFTDVSAEAWYYEDMQKAVAAGIFAGSGEKLSPEQNITRQEAFAVFARAYQLKKADTSVLNRFSDFAEIADWAKQDAAAMVSAGYVNGADGRLNPKNTMTRAEFAVILYHIDRAAQKEENESNVSALHILKTSGTYTEVPDGDVMIASKDVTLKDVVITGDLILSKDIGTGEVALSGVTVKGQTRINGGGQNSVICNNSVFGDISINNQVSKLRLVGKGTTVFKSVDVYTNAVLEGNFQEIKVYGGNVSVSGRAEKLTAAGTEKEKISLSIEKNAVVKNCFLSHRDTLLEVGGKIEALQLEDAGENSTVKVAVGGTVIKIVVRASGARIDSVGKVETIQVYENNVKISVSSGTKVTAASGVEVKVNNKTVSGETITVSGGSSTGGGGSSGGGSSKDTKYKLSIYKVVDGGAPVLARTMSVKEGYVFYKAAADEIKGYTLDGIFTDAACTKAYQNDKITANTDLYLKYSAIIEEENAYTVQVYKVLADTSEIASTQEIKVVKNGTLDTAKLSGISGYTFAGLYLDKDFSRPFSGAITGNMGLYAKYEKTVYIEVNVYKVQADTMTVASKQAVQVKQGEKLSNASITPIDGYSFAGFYTDENLTIPFEAAVTNPVTVYAKYEVISVDAGLSILETDVNALISAKKYGYGNWFSPANRYLFSAGNNGEMDILQFSEGTVAVSRIDSSGKTIDSFSIPASLPIFGGAHRDENGNYYLVLGQTNTDDDDTVPVFRIEKYDSNWNKIKETDISDVYTAVPVDACNLTMDSANGKLVIYTGRTRYLTPDDGLRHQSNINFVIDTDTMQVEYKGAQWPFNHVSHCFASYVKMDGSKIVYVSHGDAYPRSINLQVTENNKKLENLDIITFDGVIGANFTGATLGGFEVSDSSYLVIGAKTETQDSTEPRRVFLAVVPKNAADAEVSYLTSTDVSVKETHISKISDNQFVLTWRTEKDNILYACTVDGSGTVLKGPEVVEAPAPYNLQPLVKDGQLYWYSADAAGKAISIYKFVQ